MVMSEGLIISSLILILVIHMWSRFLFNTEGKNYLIDLWKWNKDNHSKEEVWATSTHMSNGKRVPIFSGKLRLCLLTRT